MLTDRVAAGTVAPRPPDIARSRVHVWFAALDHSDADTRGMAERLSPEERARAGRFCFERDRNRFIAARSILRDILGNALAVDPGRVAFRYGRFGKPGLGGVFRSTEIRFSVSHSHGGALFAVTRGREVGVDLELIRPLEDLDALAERCFSAREYAGLRSLRGTERLQGFFDGWTRKEAFLKAKGDGLSFPLAGCEVSLAPGCGPRSLRVPGDAQEATRWTLTSLSADPAYSAALVVEGREWHLCSGRWAA